MYLHHLIINSCTKCMQMLSGLFAIQTNSLISFHEQSRVLLHQGTTFNKLLALVYHRKDLCKISHAEIPPITCTWWPRTVLCNVTLPCSRMQFKMKLTGRCTPHYMHLVAKSSTTSGHLEHSTTSGHLEHSGHDISPLEH